MKRRFKGHRKGKGKGGKGSSGKRFFKRVGVNEVDIPLSLGRAASFTSGFPNINILPLVFLAKSVQLILVVLTKLFLYTCTMIFPFDFVGALFISCSHEYVFS